MSLLGSTYHISKRQIATRSRELPIMSCLQSQVMVKIAQKVALLSLSALRAEAKPLNKMPDMMKSWLLGSHTLRLAPCPLLRHKSTSYSYIASPYWETSLASPRISSSKTPMVDSIRSTTDCAPGVPCAALGSTPNTYSMAVSTTSRMA